MHNSVKRNIIFEKKQIPKTFDKTTILSFFCSINNLYQQAFPSEQSRGHISVTHDNSNSDYSLEEFQKYYSNSDGYTDICISVGTIFSKLSCYVIISPQGISITVTSDDFTKAELEDFLAEIEKEIRKVLSANGQHNNDPTNTSNPPNKKTPFYKSGVFWGAVGALATIATFIISFLG